jgi:hypothetical protein
VLTHALEFNNHCCGARYSIWIWFNGMSGEMLCRHQPNNLFNDTGQWCVTGFSALEPQAC